MAVQISRFTVLAVQLSSPRPLQKPTRTPSPLSAESPPRRDTDEVPSSPVVVASEVPARPVAVALLFSALDVVVSKAMAMIAVADVTTLLVEVVALAGRTMTSPPGTVMRPSTLSQNGSFWKRSTSTDSIN